MWNTKAHTGFLQRDPKEGEPPSEKTLVWVAYDEKHLYVAARMFDSEPEKIISRLGRRDDFVDSDWFVFSIDPYYDKRSGYRFALTPAGTIFDQVLYNDEWDDSTWDGIWKGKELNSAVFVYVLDGYLINGQTINQKGNISLIR